MADERKCSYYTSEKKDWGVEGHCRIMKESKNKTDDKAYCGGSMSKESGCSVLQSTGVYSGGLLLIGDLDQRIQRLEEKK